MSDALSVSALTDLIKRTLSAEVGTVTVEGEVSQFTPYRTGHWYFSLKDAGAVLAAVMFRGNNQMMRWTPAQGDRVVVTGDIDVYAPQGKYSLLVRRMERAGAGDLAARLEALKQKLAAEGLFDPARKRKLPAVPLRIGVATSPSGAALQDILRVLDRRFAGLTIYLSPCKVQGEGAPDEIVRAIERLNAHGLSEVIIVGRGGGSAEDLAAFNAESVARAIARSAIPVVSAVGHEVDVSIADLVADLRAATPSHAAELVVPEREALLMGVDALGERLDAAIDRSLRRRRERLAGLRLRDPAARVAEGRARLAALGDRLALSIRRALSLRRERVLRLRLRDPLSRLAEARLRVGRLGESLSRAAERRLRDDRARLGQLTARLGALSPTRVLDRGYALALREGVAVRDAATLRPGDALDLRFARGQVRVVVAAAPGSGGEGA
jgi:exodeoxyribonuclease VII large subunit